MNLKDKLNDNELDLSMADLQEVPVKDIAIIKRATILDLSNNQLALLGNNFAPSLLHLVKLDLSQNQLKELPENFGQLRNLRDLDLYNNKLQHLPMSLGQCKNLRWLDVKNNPLVPALADVAGPCLDAKQCQTCAKRIVSFLLNLQVQITQEYERLAEIKKEEKKTEALKQPKKLNLKNTKSKVKQQKAEQANHHKGNHNGGFEPTLTSTTQAEEKAQTEKKMKKSSSLFLHLWKCFMLASFFSALTVLWFAKFDPHNYELIKESASYTWNKTVEALPSFVVEQSEYAYLHIKPTISSFSENLCTLFTMASDRMQNVYKMLVNEQFVKGFVSGIVDTHKYMYRVIMQFVNKFLNEFPNYIHAVKNYFV